MLSKYSATLNVFLSLMLYLVRYLEVPVLLSRIGEASYGQWVLYSSISIWMLSMDFGIGSGTRQQLSYYFSKKQKTLYALTLSRGFVKMLLAALGLMLLSALVGLFTVGSTGLDYSIFLIVALSTSLYMFLKWTHVVLYSQGLVFMDQSVRLMSKLVFIYILYDGFFTEIAQLITINFITPIFLIFVPFLILLRIHYKVISKTKLDKRIFLDVNVGKDLFIIQLAMLLVFNVDIWLIGYFFELELVTKFSLIMKLYTAPFLIYSVYTNSKIPGLMSDFEESKIKFNKSFNQIAGISVIVGVIMILLLPFVDVVITYWTGVHLDFGFEVKSAICVFFLGNIYASYQSLRHTVRNQFQLQRNVYTILALINIPMSVFLLKLMGLVGIPISSIFCVVILGVILARNESRI